MKGGSFAPVQLASATDTAAAPCCLWRVVFVTGPEHHTVGPPELVVARGKHEPLSFRAYLIVSAKPDWDWLLYMWTPEQGGLSHSSSAFH